MVGQPTDHPLGRLADPDPVRQGEALFAIFQIDGVEDGLALTVGQRLLEDLVVGGVDHQGQLHLADDLLEEAANKFVGTNDFSAFGAPHQPGGSTIRRIFASKWEAEGPDLIYEVLGNAFLYHMVRRLVIYLVEIGQGKRNPEEINGLLRGDHKNLVQGLAPAQGLTLEEVLYLPEKDDYNSKK